MTFTLVRCPCSSASYLHCSAITFSLPDGHVRLSTTYNYKTSKRSTNNKLLFTPKSIHLIKKTETAYPLQQESSDTVKQFGANQNRDFPIREEDDGENPNLYKGIYTSQVLDLVGKIRDLPFSQRVGIIEFIKKDYCLDTISSFNDLLIALFMANELQVAVEMCSNLSSLLLEPDCVTYSVLIRCYCKKDEIFEAKSVLNEMMKNGFHPDVAVFTELINSFCKRGRMQVAFEVFEVMGQVGCDPTINTYNCLLKGLCYVGRIEEAYEMLMNLKKSSKKMDIYTYTAVMNGFCKVGRSNEAMELLDEAVGIGLVPNVVTYNTLFNGYFKEGRPLEGIDLLKQMKERDCVPDYISYSTLLHGLLKWGKLRYAYDVYKEMVGIGFEVDERMMNTLLRGMCRRSRTRKELLKDAYGVFDRMKGWGYAIYPCAYELVIEAFCVGKQVDKALASVDEMVRIGHFPEMDTLKNVVGLLCVEGKLKDALSVLVLVYDDNDIAGAFPFDMLIDEFNRWGMPSSACGVYGAALKRGVVPKRKPGKCRSR